ncbi:MAG: hypothetical protein WEB53_14250 [Akkermansiaceae bacterium]
MKPSIEQLGNLLALRRDERPEEGYWQDFLCEFHQNQREQAAKKSGFMNWVSSVTTWFSDLSPSKWAYGAGLAYASVTVAFFLMPRGVEVEKAPVAPVNYQVVPAPAPPLEQLEQLDLSPSTQGTAGEQIF